MKRFFLAAIFFLLLPPSFSRAQEASPETSPDVAESATASGEQPSDHLRGEYEGTVERVIDANYVVIDDEKMALIGVSAPRRTNDGKTRDCSSAESAAYLEGLVKDQVVSFSYERLMGIHDLRGREQINLYANGELLNAKLIATGNALALRTGTYAEREHFLNLEAKAKRQSLGLWHRCPVDCLRADRCGVRNW
jgi:endonuclease YncB( thermonuclease family)